MLLKISKNIVGAILFVVLAMMLLWVSTVNNAKVQTDSSYAVIHLNNVLGTLASNALSLVLCCLSIFTAYQIKKSLRVVENNLVSLVLFSALGLSCSLVSSISIMEAFSALFALISLLFTIRIHNQNSVLGLLFLNAILIGAASIFFYPSIILLLTVVLTIAFFRPFEIRNYVVTITGLNLVAFYTFCFYYLFSSQTTISFELSRIQFDFSRLAFNPLLLLFLIAALLSMVVVFTNRAKFIVRQRNQLIVILIYLALSVFLLVFFNSRAFLLGIVPLLSIFMLYSYSIAKRKWLYDVGILLFVVAVLWLKL